MVQTETEGGRCERHPKHLTSVGVCPYCLREALSRRFPASSFGSVVASSSSSSSSTTSSSHYSSLSFFVVSPSHNDLMRPRPSFHFEGSVEERELVVQSKPLMKSQSLVFTRDRKEESKEKEEEKENKKKKKKKKKEKKKGRFWSRLLSGSSKRREEGVASLYSKTFKRNLLPTGFH